MQTQPQNAEMKPRIFTDFTDAKRLRLRNHSQIGWTSQRGVSLPAAAASHAKGFHRRRAKSKPPGGS